MTRLAYDAYLRHLERESTRLRQVLAACDPDARVPGCPDWSASNLLGHHGGVLDFWATVVERRPTGPDDLDEPTKPSSYAGLMAYHEEQAGRLVDALRAADPAEHAWTWSQEQTVGFTFRRQAHEALIHRLDAEQTAGTTTPLDPALAADGVDEALDVMFGGCPPWGTFTPDDQLVRVDLTDTGDAVWVRLGRFHGTAPDGTVHDSDDLHVVDDADRSPDAVVAGEAAVLDAWLWRRAPGDGVERTGAPQVLERFHACVDHPVD